MTVHASTSHTSPTICSQQPLGYDLTIPDNTKNLWCTTQLLMCCCYRSASPSSVHLHFEKHGVNGSVVRLCPHHASTARFHVTSDIPLCITAYVSYVCPYSPTTPRRQNLVPHALCTTPFFFPAYPCSSRFFSDLYFMAFLRFLCLL